jgi:hypothetical protein
MKREIRGQLTCRKKKAQCEPRRLDPIPRAADDGPINFCSFAGRLTCTHMVGMVIFPNKSQGQPWCVVMGLEVFRKVALVVDDKRLDFVLSIEYESEL